jgi:NhaA family Na+:H+ antiporter
MSHFIATWLLPIFFCLVGIELKGEVTSGVFKRRSDLFIPFSAALFGVILPFLIYETFVQLFNISNAGWGVVVATDLPLALLAIKVFTKETVVKLRPYLLSLAIFDDLISIVLIAIIYHQNGIHPTVYGFLIGLLLPAKSTSTFFKILNKLSNYLIIPIFVISVILENLTIQIGLITLAVLVARMGGKPIGVLFGDYLGRLITKSKILNTKEVLAVGAIAALGLSVSLLFAEIADAPKIVFASVLIVIPIALIRIKVLSKAFMKGNF